MDRVGSIVNVQLMPLGRESQERSRWKELVVVEAVTGKERVFCYKLTR